MQLLKPRDVAKMLDVTVNTLQRWDREGTLKANRFITGRRFYTTEQIENFKSSYKFKKKPIKKI